MHRLGLRSTLVYDLGSFLQEEKSYKISHPEVTSGDGVTFLWNLDNVSE